MTGRVSEIFDSIQGEGLYFGERQIFVRLFGCNIRCAYCDTLLESFEDLEPQQVLARILNYPRGFHRISFTGGEPLMQTEFLKEVFPLVHRQNLQVYLETNGTLPRALEEVIGLVDVVAMDVKLPSSTGLPGFWDEHKQSLQIAKKKDVFVKAVVSLGTREEELVKTIDLINDSNSSAVLILQPNNREDDALLRSKMEYFRDLCVSYAVPVCIIPQVHKLLGVR